MNSYNPSVTQAGADCPADDDRTLTAPHSMSPMGVVSLPVGLMHHKQQQQPSKWFTTTHYLVQVGSETGLQPLLTDDGL
jgi:hypothetical protein